MGYEEIKTTIPRLDEFPRLDNVPEIEQWVNELFTPYIFFKKSADGIELWCSCCRKHGLLQYPARTITFIEQFPYEGEHNDEVVCPYCGARATYKSTARLGRRKNLEEYHPVVILSERDGDLFARAYWTRKRYRADLIEAPTFYLVEAYHFTPGMATIWIENYDKWTSRSISESYDPVHRVITEPFIQGSGYWYKYCPYAVYGIEAIERSAFRYCQYESFERGVDAKWGQKTIQTHSEMMKYLAACSIYPRHIEMLMKTGFDGIVWDLVCGRKKNRDVLDWSKDNYKDALGLSVQELRQWRDAGADEKSIAYYKKLRRKGIAESFYEIARIRDIFTDEQAFIRLCCAEKIRPSKLLSYLEKNFMCSDPRVPDEVFGIYKDYLEMANMLGWDLNEPTIRFPKRLQERHDEVAAEIGAFAAHGEICGLPENINRRIAKYNFEMDGWFIRCAISANEITAEGKQLSHCVGGYAQKHMANQLTILFLRESSNPGKPVYTIEMNGNRLIQIHGYRNDVGKAQPRDTMAWILEPWLNWIEKGSKRNEDGSPKLPGKRRTKTA